MKSAALVELVVGILFLLGLVGGGAWFGYDAASTKRAKEVADLLAEKGALQGQLALADSINQGNASQLVSLRKTLQAEKDQRLAIERANQAELASRAGRIAQLERAAGKRLESITKKANQDEDCADLRTLPVCAAVAERLWGDAAAARPH